MAAADHSLVLPQKDFFNEIFYQTVEDMKNLGTYRPEFSSAIQDYAELRTRYKILMEQFYAGGCQIEAEYTNKAGASNLRKTALYQAIQDLQRDILTHETQLGLTPAGLRKISDKAMKGKGENPFMKAFGEMISQYGNSE